MSSHKGIFKNSELETISSKLKFVSMLQPGQKISVNTQAIQENTYWTSMVRSLTGENRIKVYKYISDVMQDSFSILDSLSNSSNEYDIQICKNLITDLILLKPGLNNLQKTYDLDKMYVSKIATLIQNLEVNIRKLCSTRNIDYNELYDLAQAKMQERRESADCVVGETDVAAVVANVINDTEAPEEGQDVVNNKDSEVKNQKQVKNDEVKNDEVKDDEVNDDEVNDDEVEDEKLVDLEEKKKTKKTTKKEKGKLLSLNQVKKYVHDVATSDKSSDKPPLPPLPKSDKDNSNLVSFLRTLPPEDLLLMSTSTSNDYSSYGVNGHEGKYENYENENCHRADLYDVRDTESTRSTGMANNRENRRKRNKKQGYQYNSYYMSPPDDVTLCNSNLEKGIIQ